MNNFITTQELKTKGAQLLDSKTTKYKEAIITVRGKSKFVVLTMAHYNNLRECELELALHESEKNIRQKKYKIQSIKQHIKELKHV